MKIIWLARSLEIVLTLGLVIGFGIVIWLVLESQSSEPGAGMVLMGLPSVGLVMLVMAIALLAVRHAWGSLLTVFENRLMLVMPLAVIIPGIPLILLG